MATMHRRHIELDFEWIKGVENIACSVLWAALWMTQEEGLEPMARQVRMTFALAALKATTKMMEFVEQVVDAAAADDDD